MSEIQTQTQQKSSGGQRCKKLATRIDLTPMVDLGFLLITFFVCTTSLSKPMAMHLSLPSERKTINEPKITANKVLTLILADEHRVGYYQGNDTSGIKFTNYGINGVREVILKKKQAVLAMYGNNDELTILIKPGNECIYKNVVETLDEMMINKVSRYMLLDLTQTEKNFIQTHI